MGQIAKAADPDLSLAAKVAFLRRADTHADRPSHVDAIETHMSWVFVTSRFAYKMKKPIRRDTLDYSTLAARLLNCRREVELNRRLAPDVYLGVVPLTLEPGDVLHLGGDGTVVEWLVQMRRLAEERTLRHAIVTNAVEATAVQRAAARLVTFFRDAPIVPTEPNVYCRRLEKHVHDTRTLLRPAAYGLAEARLDGLAARILDFISANPTLVGARAACVIEGHGDLRPEHIYLGEPPVVTDCLEFDRNLRLLDPLDELAFLAMECEMLGSPAVGDWLIDAYRIANAAFAPVLVEFYKSCAALLRARLAAWHLDDPDVADPGKWRQRTRRYVDIADRHARLLPSPAGRRADTAH